MLGAAWLRLVVFSEDDGRVADVATVDVVRAVGGMMLSVLFKVNMRTLD